MTTLPSWLEKVYKALDIPSGTVVGLFTLIIIGMCVSAFASGKEIVATVLDTYKFVIGIFAASKTVQAFKKEEPKNE